MMALWLYRGLLAAMAFATPLTAQASDKVYKSVGPDGRVTYSQTPSPSGQVDKKLEFQQLPATPLPDYVLKFRQEMERSLAKKQEGAAPVESTTLRLFNAKWCGYCRQAEAWLKSRGLSYQSVDIDTPAGMSEFVKTGRKGGVPLLLGPKVQVQGFSAQAYEVALAKRPP